MPRAIAIMIMGVVAGLTLPAFAPQADAQGGFMPGFISGVVRDIDGEPVAGAIVIGENSEWQREVETSTNDDGRFSFVGLQTGRWLFIVRRRGFEPVQGFANVLGSGRGGGVTFVLEADPLHPPAPSTGVLANIRGDEIQEALDAADVLFEKGEDSEAIEAYESLLEQVPRLTGVHLQIGHAYLAQNDRNRALSAYRAIPADDRVSGEAQRAIAALQSAGQR